MKRSPTAIASEWLRSHGYIVDVCERWIPGANIRKDLFGFADLVAINAEGVVLVQVTSIANMSSRRKKIEDIDEAWRARSAGVRVWVIGATGKRIVRSESWLQGCELQWETEDLVSDD